MCAVTVSKCGDVPAPLRYTQIVPQARPPYRLSTLPTGARVVSTELAIDVLGDMLFQPLLDPAELEKERLVVLEELRMYQDSPQEYVHSLFEQISWPNHPLGRDVGGTEASVRALSRDDLVRYLEA